MTNKLCIAALVLLVCFSGNAQGKAAKKNTGKGDIGNKWAFTGDFVLVKGGTIQWGTDLDGKPRTMTLPDFSIGKYEVTWKQWSEVIGTKPSEHQGDNLPVENVSWNEIQTFIKKLTLKESGHKYRLPTEAEWVYAARGGASSRGYTYSGSNTLGDVAWFRDNSGSKTHEVGTKQPNELGIYDMNGNVWEWCWDWFGEFTSNARVLRGGSFTSLDDQCRSTLRPNYEPSYRYADFGFRCVRN